MTVFDAVLLGAVQGLTEFLPVSSDGHLAVFQAALGEGSLAMDVALHAGTLLSMVLFFRHDLRRLLTGLLSRIPGEERTRERHRAALILVATAATGVVGLGLKSTVERFNASLPAAGVGFLLTALWLWGGESRGRRTGEGGVPVSAVPLWQAAALGLAQGAAVWPGLSRSASTIGLALLLGWRWTDAGRFSFLAAIPAIFGATLLTARDIAALPLAPAAAGFGVSFLVGTLSLGVLMRFLAARRLWPFAVYCLLISLYCLFKSL